MGNQADQCEIRIPTYKRPSWLKEAIASLINQTHQNWHAIVLDDDPDGSGQDVVKVVGDPRIQYLATDGVKGAAENLSRAFRKEPYRKNPTFFAVLEDDNWLTPHYLEKSIQLVKDQEVNLIHTNQECWWRPKSGHPYPMGGTTLETVLPAGRLSSEYLHAGVFFFQGISNGSLFWTKDLQSDLSARLSRTRDAYVQEMLRCRAIVEPSYCSHTCLSIWTDSAKETKHRIFESGKLADEIVSAIKLSIFRELKSKKMLRMLSTAFSYHSEMRSIDPILWNKQLVHSIGLDLARTSYWWLLLYYPKQTIGNIARKLARQGRG